MLGPLAFPLDRLLAILGILLEENDAEVRPPMPEYNSVPGSYTEAEILQAERYVLKTLDWNMSYPNPIHFLRRTSKADDYNVQVRTIAKYLLEIQCLEWRLIAAPPSLVSAAAIWLARLILGFTEWVCIVSGDVIMFGTDSYP